MKPGTATPFVTAERVNTLQEGLRALEGAARELSARSDSPSMLYEAGLYRAVLGLYEAAAKFGQVTTELLSHVQEQEKHFHVG